MRDGALPSAWGPGGTFRRHLPFVLIVVVCAVLRLWRSPYDTSQGLIVPDGVEYAVAAERFAHLGRYDIAINGMEYPARYAPFFSVVVLSPAYWIGGREIGAGIIPVLLLCIGGVIATYAVGATIRGITGGLAAALAVLMHVETVRYARTIMTDAPAALGTIALLWAFLRLWERPSWRNCLVPGVIVGCLGGMRIENFVLVVPLVVGALRGAGPRGKRVVRLLLIAISPSAVFLATAVYHWRTFGSWTRTGYNFWCPLPYDYLPHLFSWRNVGRNLAMLGGPGMYVAIALLIAGATILRRSRFPLRAPLGIFFVIGMLPLAVFHLLYFYFPLGTRLQLPLFVFALVVGAAGSTIAIPRRLQYSWVMVAILVSCVVFVPRPADFSGNARSAAERLVLEIPDDVALITTADPVFLEPLVFRGTHRSWIPLFREQEYASKAVSYHSLRDVVKDIPWPSAHRDPRVLSAGAIDVVPWAVDESPEQLIALIRSGRIVCLDGVSVPPGSEEYAALMRAFELTPVREGASTLRVTLKPGLQYDAR